ncbi:MAG: OmpA family protein [Tepidisphaeraceae bacterium]|jgi:flagellar motor protein MotB
MASSCKCKKPAECEECPEWIFTFADLVMLMMGFFVILWVLKPNPGKKGDAESNQDWVKVVAAIREAFGYIPNPNSKDPVDMQMIINGLSKVKMDGPGSGKVLEEPKGPEGTDPEVTNIRPARQATEGGKMLFERGSADLSAQTKEELDEVADVIRGHRNIVMVKGHTSLDDLPEDATAEDKMDLSLRRAQAAANYLVEKGIDPELLRVQGCSTFEPLTQRQYTLDAQRLNRRIEVEATATLLDELQKSDSQSVPPADGDSSTQEQP